MTTFAITAQGFERDGQPVQLISGAIHYFRVHPDLWEDRLRKALACGLNCVETYVPWNAHEPRPGEYDFSGILDLARFLTLAGELGLMAIVRPSPYICAEWEFGGLPAWLLADPGMRVRCNHRPFLDAVDRYYATLMPILAPLQVTHGGPVVLVQIENEYGSYGNDRDYLAYLEKAMTSHGIDVPLFTSDGPTHQMLQGGTLPHVFKTANFGSGPEEGFKLLREYQPDGPLMCAEFWCGWFDHWTEQHHTRDAADAAKCLDEMLSAGASVNVYMFHGGTNFGFWNGANHGPGYQPTVTSYDYDSPLSESGDVTPKFLAFRDAILRRRQATGVTAPLPPLPEPLPKIAPGEVRLAEVAPLFPNLAALSPAPVRTVAPEPMESVGQNLGFILYRTRVTGPRHGENLNLQDVHDRALIFQDGRLLGVRYRNDDAAANPIVVNVPAEGSELSILVENMGRVNYGPRLLDRKGITEGVRLGGQFQFGWEIFPLPLEPADIAKLAWQPTGTPTGDPAFYRGTFTVESPADTFVALSAHGWTKGVVWVNGFNLGRYWNIDPQRNLYVPGPLLRPGENEIVVFELHGQASASPAVELVDRP